VPAPSPTPAPTPDPAPISSSADTITITSPSSGASVASPFTLKTTGSTCSSQAVTAIGYSLDTGTAIVSSSTSLNLQVISAAGAHTIKVTAWTSSGASCNASVAITVTAPAPVPPSLIPANAVTVTGIQDLANWSASNDSAASGSSTGTTSLVISPSLSGKARQFITSFANYGNERYWVSFGNDTTAMNFFYDVYIYIQGPVTNIGNLEFDMNQVLTNGQTVIYGFQCDGYSGTWDYTVNSGTPTSPIDHWVHTGSACNPQKWTPNAWHHVQISYSRDTTGKVTYGSVWLDGAESKINATAPSAFALGWGSVLLTNFQVDGIGTGTNTVYLDNVTISRW
jgi:hypothetical protein